MQKTTVFFLFLTALITVGLPSSADAAVLVNGGYITDAFIIAGVDKSYTFEAEEGDHVEIRTDGEIGTGSYDLYFALIPGTNEMGMIYNGEIRSETIDLGDLDTCTFIADVGETIHIEMTDMSASGDLMPRIELYGPSSPTLIMMWRLSPMRLLKQGHIRSCLRMETVVPGPSVTMISVLFPAVTMISMERIYTGLPKLTKT